MCSVYYFPTQAYLFLSHCALLCFPRVAFFFFFYKLKARPSTNTKTMTHLLGGLEPNLQCLQGAPVYWEAESPNGYALGLLNQPYAQNLILPLTCYMTFGN